MPGWVPLEACLELLVRDYCGQRFRWCSYHMYCTEGAAAAWRARVAATHVPARAAASNFALHACLLRAACGPVKWACERLARSQARSQARSAAQHLSP